MKLRIRFTKHGTARFIGHLDIQRYFQKLNRRAGINVVYSEGFSPHQKMSFAMPLSVGYESDGEYFDMEVKDAASSEAVISSMNANSAEGIRVTGCVMLPEGSVNAMASVRAADYLVRLKSCVADESDITGAVESFNASESFIVKKENKKAAKRNKGKHRAGGEESPAFTEIDLKSFVYELRYDNSENGIFMKVSAGSADNIKPELVIGSLMPKDGAPFASCDLMITRKELYTDGMTPLINVGRVF
ncbi:MAG: DUF2344 domain-containing protein [Lachnospiraceae bacterium]|nr:DUF2344 domain-containing protein [Lachnospiraceae bacterium]